MALELHKLTPAQNSKKRKKRVGRGNASGHGTYSTRGGKGQTARSGGSGGLLALGFKQTLRRIPKLRGFKSHKLKSQVVSLSDIEKNFQANEVVDPKRLLEKGLIDTIKVPVKILANGKIVKPITLRGCFISRSAKALLEQAGGKAE